MKGNLPSVREMSLKDIPLVLDYWLASPDEYMEGMGLDLSKIPSEDVLRKAFTDAVNFPIKQKKAYYLIWELDNRPVGYSNINQIEFGKHATMHLHLLNTKDRRRGLGVAFVKKSLPFYFKNFDLEELICQPYALNPAPSKTVERVGFEFVKRHTCVPGASNFEQEVLRWKITKEKFEESSDWENA